MPTQTKKKTTASKLETKKQKRPARTLPFTKSARVKASGEQATSSAKTTTAMATVTPGDPRLEKVLALLAQNYPQPSTALAHRSPLQLLVATILSAQCTDERVNKVTPRLFETFPSARDLAQAPREKLEELIHSTGFFRAKAKSIQGACQILHEKYAGEVPSSMDQLLELPGVARKTANVVLGSAFGLTTGVVVDTHVKRLALRLGLTKQTDPNKIEQDLMALIPKERWIDFSHQLILHGRAVCVARKPRCPECALATFCPTAESGAGNFYSKK